MAFIVILGLLAGAVMIVLGISGRRRDKKSVTDNALLVLGILLAIGVLLASSFQSVPAGHRGVLLRFGKVSGIRAEGLAFKFPLIDSIVNMSVQTQLYEHDATAASKDLQDVKTSVALNYKIPPDAVGEIYRTLGVRYIEIIAKPAIQETVKEITAKFNAEDMILKRAEVKEAVAAALEAKLSSRSITAETINITNFVFSAEFTKAIESKVVAVQRVLEAENKLNQIEVEARQAKIAAEGQANAAIAAAQGQAQALTIVTDAQAAANIKISASLSADVLQYIFLDRLGKDVKVIVIPAGSNLALGDVGVLSK